VTTKLLYFVSHPIQYQAPLLRQISADQGIDIEVIFESDFSSDNYFDRGFGVDVNWDIPLREGYKSQLLSEIDINQRINNAEVFWFHGWQSHNSKHLLKMANRAGKPILMRGENWEGAMPDGKGMKSRLKRLYLNNIFSKCDAFLAIGSANRQYYLDHGIPQDKIFDMPYAIDNSFFARPNKAPLRLNFRQELGIEALQKIVLFAGKLTARKKPDVLLSAWKQADWDDHQRPALVFVGDGELKQSLMSEVEQISNRRDVYFTGFRNQTELPAIYKAADVFVLSSEKEPWGLAINEAMACGTAVIASDQCGAVFDLVDDETGVVVKAGDAADLAAALSKALERSDEMGQTAKRRISNWDFEADVAGLKAALEYVL